MQPDFRTLVLILAVTSLVSALALYLFYRLLSEVPGLKQAAIAGACQSIGSIFLLVQDRFALLFTIMVLNAAYFLAYAFYYQAARLFCGLAMEWRWPAIIIATLYPLFALFSGIEHLSERIIVSSIGLGALTLMTSWVLWKDKDRLPGRRSLAITFALIALFSLTRVVSILIEPPGNIIFLDFERGSVLFIWGIVASMAVTIGVIVMTSERLREQLKRQLQEVMAARDTANKVLREQKNFMALLSHEFKTPLSIIKANADAVATIESPPAPFVKQSLERIQQTSVRLTHLVEGCLNNEWIAHLVEKNELSMSALNLVELLEGLCQEYGIRFVSSDAPADAEIPGDRYLLPILFSSLLDNARKYARNLDNVEVRLSRTHHEIIVEVFDDGPGIAQQERERIFDKYYSMVGEKRQQGSGLGLFFARRIAEQHGGGVNVVCLQGTTFTVTLPVPGGG